MVFKHIIMTKSLFKTLVCSLFLYSNLAVHSQLNFSAGLETGLSSTQVSGDGLSGFDKFGLSAGPFVRATWSETSSARFSILYLNKGSRKNANPKINDFRTYVLRLNYIEVPILYNYTYQEKFRGEAGIAIGTLISSNQLDNDLEFGFVRPFNSTEYSLIVGLNYLFSEDLFLNLRYSNSIIPVRGAPSSGNTFSFYESGQFNSVLQFMIGYEF